MNKIVYKDKLKAAIIGRFAGCALGAPVEMMELDKMKEFCKSINQDFPPRNYFKYAPNPDGVRYKVGKGRDFTSSDMKFLSTDDDIMYTVLSLIMLEKHPQKLHTKHISNFWLKFLPIECTYTAERTTLSNLQKGVSYDIAYLSDKDETDFIGAAIRVDGYAYVNPGNPKKAVELAYQDAILTHRGDGVNSALYFAALISLAFTSKDIVGSLYEALKYIDDESNFYKEISWALSIKDTVTTYQTANDLVTERYPNMEWAHAVNNACLTVWGINIGKYDYEKGITETVAMGYDNDCTAATVGSVLGAYLGMESIDSKWYAPWDDKILSYLNDIDLFSLTDIIERFFILGCTNLHDSKKESS